MPWSFVFLPYTRVYITIMQGTQRLRRGQQGGLRAQNQGTSPQQPLPTPGLWYHCGQAFLADPQNEGLEAVLHLQVSTLQAL